MVLAEIVASGELQSIVEPGETIAVRRPLALHGEILAEGIGLGHAVLHEPRVIIKNFVADDPAGETTRLDEALDALRANIDELVDRGGKAGQGEHIEILEALRMVANDKGWLRRLHEAIGTGLTAEAAVDRVQNDTRARMLRSTDPYLRERLHDLDDLASRLLHQLVGVGFHRAKESLPDNAILVARAMGPTALLEYDRARLRGLVLEEGGASSHVAVIARALGLPAVSGIANIAGIVEPGDAIIIDGVSGEVRVRPQPDVEAAYAERARMRARRQEQFRKLRDVPAVTRDGVVVSLIAQRWPLYRSAASRRYGRRRHRPPAHRAAVHDLAAAAIRIAAGGALSRRHRGRGLPARRFPHARYRRRQDASLFQARRRGESGARLARHPHRA